MKPEQPCLLLARPDGKKGLQSAADHQWPRSRARKLGAYTFPINAGEGSATAAAGVPPPPPCPTTAAPAAGGGGGPSTVTAKPWHAQDGRRRPQPCGGGSARSRKGQQVPQVAAVGLLQSGDVLLAQA
jgi:hypothetical protein